MFRSLGFTAQTDVTVEGPRTNHDIDVLVRTSVVGFDVVWAVECKKWKTPVSKVHVLALRQIVAEIGADRGILLCEVGFQSGAAESAALTNVHLSTLSKVREQTRQEVEAVRVRDALSRTTRARERYWEIPKNVRIAFGLREEYAAWYSGFLVLQFADQVLAKVLLEAYPVRDVLMPGPNGPSAPLLSSTGEVLAVLEPMLEELEQRLDSCWDASDLWSVS